MWTDIRTGFSISDDEDSRRQLLARRLVMDSSPCPFDVMRKEERIDTCNMDRRLNESPCLYYNDIFRQRVIKKADSEGEISSRIKIYQGVTEINSCRPRILGAESCRFVPDEARKIKWMLKGWWTSPEDSESAKKRPIKTFSQKSRMNMMRHVGMLRERPQVFQTLTFADDVMDGKTENERVVYATVCMNRLQKKLDRLRVHGIWKREIQSRKHGRLIGERCPHYHIVHWIDGSDPVSYEEFYRLVIKIAAMWVEITGTLDPKAYSVACHSKSWSIIKSTRDATRYMTKYMSKDDLEYVSEESIGRSWGKVGNPYEENPLTVELTKSEEVLLRRVLRRLHRKALKRYKSYRLRLSVVGFDCLSFVDGGLIRRVLEWIKKGDCIADVPF